MSRRRRSPGAAATLATVLSVAAQEREDALARVEQHGHELDCARRDLARLQRLSRSGQLVSEEQSDPALIRVRIAPDLLARHEELVKTGVPGVAYVQMRPVAPWPGHLTPRLPPWPTRPAVPPSG